VKVVGDSGVECVGVGILSDAVRFYYPTYVVVDSLEDLATNVMDQLAKALMGKRFHVNNADLLNVG
jgi:cobalamin biosynthesis protein CobT